MLLAVDVGNTNVVFAVCEGREIRARWRIATDPRRTADQYAVWLIQLMAIENIDRASIDQIIVSSVVPRALHNLDVLAQKYFGLDPVIAGQGPDGWGFQADVDEPRSLGADRAVNIVAAHDAHPGDLIIVDFGTATTFDAIDFAGTYKGGIIAPGINLSLEALVSAAAKLPRIAIEKPVTNSASTRPRSWPRPGCGRESRFCSATAYISFAESESPSSPTIRASTRSANPTSTCSAARRPVMPEFG